MPVFNITRSLAFVVIAVGCANAQTPTDPYNPATRRASTGNQQVEPSLADMGFGTDEGNMGPFVTMTDKQYAQAMAARGIMEIHLGQAALEKSQNPDVKAVAQRMIKDYLGWDAGMEKAGAKLGIQLPTEMDQKQKAEVDRICALTGPEFDKAYLKEVIHLQTKALSMSNHEAAEASVTGFRHWAGVVTPTIQEQIHAAQTALDGSSVQISKK